MTDTTTTPATATTPAPLTAYDSKTPLYAIVAEACGGFRVTTDDPIALAARMIAAATEAESKGAAGLTAAINAFPIAVAGQGKRTVEKLAQMADPAELATIRGAAGFILSLVNVRGIETKTAEGSEKRNGVIGLALYPAHPVEAFQATDEGRAFLTNILDKEQGLVAFRKLRFTPGESTEADLDMGARAMPILAEDFLPSRSAGSDGFDLFADFFPILCKRMAADPATAYLVSVLPTKRADVLAAIRSQPLAATLYPALEKANVFVTTARVLYSAAEQMRQQSEQAGKVWEYNNAAVLKWIDERAALDLLPKTKAEVDTDELAKALAAFGV